MRWSKQRPFAELWNTESGRSSQKDAPFTPLPSLAGEALLQYRGHGGNWLQCPRPRNGHTLLVRGNPPPRNPIRSLGADCGKLDRNVANLDQSSGKHKLQIGKISTGAAALCCKDAERPWEDCTGEGSEEREGAEGVHELELLLRQVTRCHNSWLHHEPNGNPDPHILSNCQSSTLQGLLFPKPALISPARKLGPTL